MSFKILSRKKKVIKKPPHKKRYMHLDDQDEAMLDKNRIGDFRAFVMLLGHAKEYRLPIIFSLALMLVSTIVAISGAKFMGDLTEKGLIARDMNQAIYFAGLILGTEVLALILQFTGRRILAKYSSLTILSVRKKLFEHLQLLPMSYYDREPQGRIVTRITHDVEGIESFFTSSLGSLLNATFMATVALGAMIVTDVKLGTILFLSMFPAVLLIYLTRNVVRSVNRGMSIYSSALNAKLSEYLSGMDVIRSFGLEDWSKTKYDDAVNDYLEAQLRANWLFSWSRPLISFMCSMPLVGLVWFGGRDVLAGAMTVGLFVAFVRYCERFFNPIMMLAREIHVIQQAFTSAERIANFMQAHTEEHTLGQDGEIKDLTDENGNPLLLKGEIEVSNLWMRYIKNEWILKNLSFKIRAGEKVGLVGTTGSGKTTTVSLFSRLYPYEEGSIKIDGVAIERFKRNFLREQIGFVSQDVVIFRGSLRENLTTDDSMPLKAIEARARDTGLLKVMEEGGLTFDSEILEGGVNISIGQRQLIAFTRVLLANPAILILDEATANIDPEYERILQQSVETVMNDKTCLIIAHRLETLKSCDRLLVFSQGELVEEGSHDELMRKQGHYFSLQKAQEQKKEE